MECLMTSYPCCGILYSEILLRYHLFMISCLVYDIMSCSWLRYHLFYDIMPCSRVNHRCFTFPSWPVHLRLHLSPQRLYLPTPIKCFTHVSPLYMTCFISKVTAFLMTKHIEAIPRNDKSFLFCRLSCCQKMQVVHMTIMGKWMVNGQNYCEQYD